ncbi:MAG: RNA-binding protein [Flavobacteriaceae bacterium]
MNIFVGNLNFQTTEEQLQDLFSSYGEVTSVKIMTDKFSGRSRGFGFIEMPDQAQAEKAITQLHDSTLNSRPMVVNEAKPRENNSRY